MLTRNGIPWLCLLIGLVALPLLFKWVPPNAWYGFRTALTLSDPVIWYRANRVAGLALLLASMASAAMALAAPAAWWSRSWLGPLVFVGPLALAVLVCLAWLALQGSGRS